MRQTSRLVGPRSLHANCPSAPWMTPAPSRSTGVPYDCVGQSRSCVESRGYSFKQFSAMQLLQEANFFLQWRLDYAANVRRCGRAYAKQRHRLMGDSGLEWVKKEYATGWYYVWRQK